MADEAKMFYTSMFIGDGKIHWTGYCGDKKLEHEFGYFKPDVFKPAPNGNFRGSDGERLAKKIVTLQEFFNLDPEECYGHISPVYQFIRSLKEKDWWQVDLKKIRVLYFDLEIKHPENIFPEPNRAKYPIISISVKDNKSGFIYVFGKGEYDPQKNTIGVDPKIIKYKQVSTEEELLKKMVELIKRLQPDVLTGWNSDLFDMPYLTNRIFKLLGEGPLRQMSPLGKVFEKTFKVFGREIRTYNFHRQSLDYLGLYKKFVAIYKPKESYSLDFIAKEELGKKKVEFEYNTISELYEKDYQKFIDYNINDANLVYLLNEKLQLMELTFTLAYEAGVLYRDILSPVKTWDVVLYNRLKDKNMEIIPRKSQMKEEYPGGYVREPEKGFHKWIMSYDLNSLYPNIIVSWNMSRETLIEQKNLPSELVTEIKEKLKLANPSIDFEDVNNYYETVIEHFLSGGLDTELLKKYNVTMSMNLEFWDRSKQGILGSAMAYLYDTRVKVRKELKNKELSENRKKSLDLKQKALKILMNAGYGAFANNWFRYFDIRLASGITTNGQMIIKYLGNKLDQIFEGKIRVIYQDTDSVYIACDQMVDQVLKKKNLENAPPMAIADVLNDISKRYIEPTIAKLLAELAEKLNLFTNTLAMTREIIGDRGIWVTKKKYVVNKLYDEDKRVMKDMDLQVKGLELVRSSTPHVVREKLKDIIKVIFKHSCDPNKIIDEVQGYKEEFKKLPPEEIASPRSINDIGKYMAGEDKYSKGTPIHVRGAILFNGLLKRHQLNMPPIMDGTKLKFVYLKVPNPNSNENVIAFVNELPKEFGLHEYIDYNTQFEKAFLSPVNIITSACGLDLLKTITGEKSTSVMDFLNMYESVV